MARPLKVIDEELLKKLAGIMCTDKEMADILGICVDTLKDRFSELINIARSQGKMSLRRFQYQAAAKGNPALLIWLGKQHLGQTDKNIELTADELKVTFNYTPNDNE